MYEWYLSILDDGDQEVIRFLRSTGEDHMASKPTSRGGATVSHPDRFNPLERFQEDFRHRGIHQRSKWERIGKPLFTPAIEVALFFTPMNPWVYRTLRAIQVGYDTSEGVHDD
jgi:hypothetical protein